MSWQAIATLPWAVLGVVWLVGALLSRRTVVRESIRSRAVYVSVLCAGTILLFARVSTVWVPAFGTRLWPSNAVSGAMGVTMTVLGVGFAIWARLHLGRMWSGSITLKEGHQLIQSGPYALVRHPIYTGFLFGLLGNGVATGTLGAVVGLLLIAAGFVVKLSREERWMADQFGAEHRDYRTRVKRLIPFIW